MLEIICKILFFVSMLVLYVNVTSTSIVIVIVLGYIVCVFSYYYFNNVRGAVDECFSYCNLNATKFSDSMNPSQVSGYFVNRKYKMSNSTIGPLGGKPKLLFSGSLCNPDSAFAKENNLFDNCGTSTVKADFKNGELPSPVLKSGNFAVRSNKLSRDKLKITFSSKEIARRNGHVFNSLNSARRYNANMDLETYMNVNSPGFTSRVVDKAAESASYHLKYPAVRQVSSFRFDKSTLRQLSKIPRVNSTTTTAAVRIAPPEAASMNLMSNENALSEESNEDGRSNNILQVLKDMSRKRNYSQEEADRSGSTPKKSRKNEMKNAFVSQHKRAHEDSSNDNLEDKSRKKRCDDTDRDIIKMMSYTSGLSIQGFTWDNKSKKRKSSKLEKSKNESPEKLEKFRKISKDCTEEVPAVVSQKEFLDAKEQLTTTTESLPNRVGGSPQIRDDGIKKDTDEVDHEKQDVSFIDEDEDYVRVAGGKILNRTNRTYRKKLISKKIDPISVISTEPEYVTEEANYIDDKVMKENLLNNLMNDIERKEEQYDNVIFYQNSILEDMANKVTVEVEVHEPATNVQMVSSAPNPPESSITQPAMQLNAASEVKIMTKECNPLLCNEPTKLDQLQLKQPPRFTFGSKSVDEVDFPKTVNKSSNAIEIPRTVSTTEVTPVVSIAFTVPLMSKSDSASKTEMKTSGTNSSTHTTDGSFTIPSSGEKKTISESATSTSVSISSANSNFAFDLSRNNPLLTKSSPTMTDLAPKISSFGNSTPENVTSGSKVSMFGTTIAPQTTTCNGTSSSSNVFSINGSTSTMNTTGTTTFSPSSAIAGNSSSVPANPSFAVSQPTSTTQSSASTNFTSSNVLSTVQNDTFKFGSAGQSSFTTSSVPSFNMNSNSTATPSTFGANTTTSFGNAFGSTADSAFPVTTEKPSLFANVASSSGPTFGFGAQNTGVFGTNTSQPAGAFNGTSSQSLTFSTVQPKGAASQSSIFGAGSNSQASLSFGATSSVEQSASVPPIFGGTTPLNSLQNAQQPLLFGERGGQPSAFGQSSLSNGPSIFGSDAAGTQTVGSGDGGNVTSSVFGKSQGATSDPAQNSQFGSNNKGFVFGNSGNNQPTSSATFTASASPFGGNVAGGQSAFNASSASSAFNFGTGPSNFGSSSSTSGSSSFAAPGLAQTTANPVFNFGNGGSASTAPTQPTFQFRPNVPSQPFMFGSSAPIPSANTGGFSIGSGGSGASNRSRATARPRKAK